MKTTHARAKPGCLTVWWIAPVLLGGWSLINAGLSGDTSSLNRPSRHRDQAAISPGQATLAGLVAITAVGSALWAWGRQPAEPPAQRKRRGRRGKPGKWDWGGPSEG